MQIDKSLMVCRLSQLLRCVLGMNSKPIQIVSWSTVTDIEAGICAVADLQRAAEHASLIAVMRETVSGEYVDDLIVIELRPELK